MTTVFISSTGRDLAAYRAAAVEACRQAGLRPVTMEDFGARSEAPVKAALQGVLQADVFLGIYGHRYGYVPEGSEISILEMEYNRAVERGLPVFVFVVDPDSPWPSEYIEGGEGRERLERFKVQLAKRHILATFRDVESFEATLLDLLFEYLKSRPSGASEVPPASAAGSSSGAPPPSEPPVSFDRLSPNARGALLRADRFRRSRGRGRVHMEHLIVGLFDALEGEAARLFTRAGLDRGRLRKALDRIGGIDVPRDTRYEPSAATSLPPLSGHAEEALRKALRSVDASGVVGTRAILVGAMAVEECRVIQGLRRETRLADALDPALDLVQVGSAQDQPTRNDKLNFKPYVWAIAEFLASEHTQPPLTLSIEGEWGSGKSSFMLQLEARLRALRDPFEGETKLRKRLRRFLREPSRWRENLRWIVPPCRLAVRFNAWRHDKEEALWAAFAMEFLRRIARQRALPRRWWGHLQLFAGRYRWRNGWFDLLRYLGVWAFLIFLGIAVPLAFWLSRDSWCSQLNQALQELEKPENGVPQTSADGEATCGELLAALVFDDGREGWRALLAASITLGGSGVYLAGLISLVLKAKELVGNPLEVNLRQYLGAPDYQDRIAFIERFHEDFGRIVGAYAGERKVYVFVDDLDRCEVPKAAELMQALNLLIADDKRLIFILGMDRNKVAAGLAVKYESLLPYLMPRPPGPDGPGPSQEALRRFGLEYGYSFLEKFIQLPFRVPAPRPEDLGEFLWPEMPLVDETPRGTAAAKLDLSAGQVAPRPMGGGASGTGATQAAVAAAGSQPTNPGRAPDSAIEEEREVRARLDFGRDSVAIRQAALMVQQALDFNPRRIKHFINLFRLKAYIANRIRLLDEVEGRRPELTLEQLAKYVAVELVWSGLLSLVEERPDLLWRLEKAALDESLEARLGSEERCWLADSRLRALLRYGCVDGEGAPLPERDRYRYSFAGFPVAKLLRVSPPVKRPPMPEPTASGGGSPAA